MIHGSCWGSPDAQASADRILQFVSPTKSRGRNQSSEVAIDAPCATVIAIALGIHAPFADRSTGRPCSTQSSLPPSKIRTSE